MRVTLGISGLIGKDSKDEFLQDWSTLRTLNPYGESLALVWEKGALRNLGCAISDEVMGYVWSLFKTWWLKLLHATVAAAYTAVHIPKKAISTMKLLANPWNVAADRSEKCGKLLASMLMDRTLGRRPVTLVGYSMGARVIYYCLEELAANDALGLVDHAFLLGAPVPSHQSSWYKIRRVVSGRLVNGFSKNDFILSTLYRAFNLTFACAGLVPVDVDGVENVNLAACGIDHHLDWQNRSKIHEVIKHVAVGSNTIDPSLIADRDSISQDKRWLELIEDTMRNGNLFSSAEDESDEK